MLSFEWSTGFGGLFLASVLFGLGGGIAMPAHMAIAVMKGDHTAAMGLRHGAYDNGPQHGDVGRCVVGGDIDGLYQLRLAFTSGSVIMVVGVGLFWVCTYPR